jgi:hypothetical protein
VRVVVNESYDPTASDVQPDVRRLLGLDPITNDRLRRHLRQFGTKKGGKTFSPDVLFDLLYIPDDYDRAALVASYMPYFNVELRSVDIVDTFSLRQKHGGRLPSVVQLLGSSGWHHESLIPRGGPAVEGALVVDVWAGGETEEFATEEGAALDTRMREALGHPASGVAAQAYDAARLLFAARRRAATRDPARARDELGRWLRTIRLDDGACGPVAIDDKGALLRDPVVLQVEGEGFVVLQ